MVQVGRVDKVAAGFDEGVEEFKGGFFGDLSRKVYDMTQSAADADESAMI